MIKSRFFKNKKHRTYDYLPRYYDPEKERVEKLIEQAKAKYGKLEDKEKEAKIKREINFREKAETQWDASAYGKGARIVNLRLIIILMLLCGIFYYIIISMPGIVQYFENQQTK